MRENIPEILESLIFNNQVVNPNASGGSHIGVRCPYCGDSNNPESYHLHIDKELRLFNCFRCSAGGVVTKKTLLDLNVDPDLLLHFKSTSTTMIRSGDGRFKPVKYPKIEVERNNKYTQRVVEYLAERMDCSLDLIYSNIHRFKIIHSLNHLYESNNNISISTIKSMKHYISYLGFKGSFIISRKISSDRSYKLPNKIDFVKRNKDLSFYTIGNKLNILSPVLKLYIGEGVTDILYYYINVMKCKNSKDTVYAAASSKERHYTRVVNYFISEGFTSIELHLLMDSNVKIEDVMKYMSGLKYKVYLDRVFYYYNMNEEDIGAGNLNIKKREFFYE